MPPAPASPPDPQRELAEFHASLNAVTPRVRVAPAIVAINAIVFAVMVASGVHVLTPTADSVLRWGADFGPRTLGGEPWRLLTNTFLHFGVIHLALNMFALWNAGALVERIYGPLAFLALYLAAGITGSVASVGVHPQVVGAGASGAVFGVYGALAAFVMLHRGLIPMSVLTRLRGAAMSFIAYNILFGFTNKSIDNAAHIGGLLGGAAAGALLARPLLPGRASAAARSALAIVGACALAAAALVVLPKPVDFQGEVGAFSTMEQPVLDRYNQLLEDARTGKLDTTACAAAIEREVLAPWRAARDRLARPRPWTPQQKRVIDLLVRYAGEREAGFDAIARAARANDNAATERANQHHKRAEELIEEIKNLKPES